MDDLDSLRLFVAQIRQAFMQAGPIPVFTVEVKRFGEFSVRGLKDIKFDVVPEIVFPDVDISLLMSVDFQEKLNKVLNKNPAVVSGQSDIKLGVDNGQRVLYNVPWRVEIHKINNLVMDDRGIIRIEEFEFRS